jgi:hypothetical protein
MSREIPEPVRAYVGLAATVLDEARRLPETLPGLPVRLVGIALQTAMKLQQHWSGLVARGDEVLTGLRGDREPGLATFDDDEEVPAVGLVAQPIDVLRDSAFDRAPDVDSTGISDEEVAELPTDPAADAVVAAVEDTAGLTEVDVMEVDVDTDAAGLVDDELAGLPQDPAPAAVVAAVEDVNDQVLGAQEAEAALGAADSALTAEDALESALLEAEGTDATPAAGTPDDAPAASDPGGSPVGELAGAPDVGSDDTTTPDAADSGTPDTDIGLADEAAGDATGDATAGTATPPDAGVLGEDAEADASAAEDAATEVDVITPDGQVTTVEGTVTDEGVVAPETGDTGGDTAGDTAGDTGAEAGGAPDSDVVTDEHVRVDEEMGTEAGPGEDSGAATDTVEPEPAADTPSTEATTGAPAEVIDEGGTPVAAATGVRTDVGDTDTAEDDAAIAEGAAVDAVGGESAAPTDDPEGGSDLSGSQAAGAAPVEGYDSFSVAQLRGRLRGYQLATVSDLLAYEEATRARAPFVTMLRNRLEKLEQQAADNSPLQPRGQ